MRLTSLQSAWLERTGRTGPARSMLLPEAPNEAGPAQTNARVAAIDLFRCVAILAVVAIHTTSFALGRLEPGSGPAFWVSLINRSSQFAVPAFLFLTALVQTRSSLSSGRQPGRFYRAQLVRTGLPYLVWSVLYALFAVATGSRSLASLASVSLWANWLLLGNASYHLYYLIIVIQFYALFPLILPLVRRWPWPPLTLAFVALQLGFYWLNRQVLHIKPIATPVLSYSLQLGLGMLVGRAFGQWPAFWARWRLAILALAGLSWALYLPQAYLALRRVPVNTFNSAWSYWLFTGAISLLLLGLCGDLDRRAAWLRPLRLLGTHSFQIYLIHPAVIILFGRSVLFSRLESTAPGLGLGYALMVLLSLALPLAFARLVRHSPVSRLLFGR